MPVHRGSSLRSLGSFVRSHMPVGYHFQFESMRDLFADFLKKILICPISQRADKT